MSDMIAFNDDFSQPQAVEFTQYLRPDGRKRTIWINRPIRIVTIARDLKRQGLRLECEVLTTEECRFTVSNDEEDLVEEICPNGDAVPGTVDKLILRAYSLTRVKTERKKPREET